MAVWCHQVGRVFRPASRVFADNENGHDGLFSRSFRPRCVHPTRWEKYGAIILCVWSSFRFRLSWVFVVASVWQYRSPKKETNHDGLATTIQGVARARLMMSLAHLRSHKQVWKCSCDFVCRRSSSFLGPSPQTGGFCRLP